MPQPKTFRRKFEMCIVITAAKDEKQQHINISSNRQTQNEQKKNIK